tara:strand:+ start:318 stop:644 length:327 start_codon:yes stop_codon:yes gene_type:complete
MNAFRLALICLVFYTSTSYGQSHNVEFKKGWAAVKQGDFLRASKILEPIAKQGDSNAQYVLGYLYERGKGVSKNLKKAAAWYELSAVQGNRQSQFAFGSLYAFGDGVP